VAVAAVPPMTRDPAARHRRCRPGDRPHAGAHGHRQPHDSL